MVIDNIYRRFYSFQIISMWLTVTLIVTENYIDHFVFTETPKLLMSYPKRIPHSTIYRIGVFSPDLLLGFRNKVICSKSCRLCIGRTLPQSQVGLIPKTMFLLNVQEYQKTNLLTEYMNNIFIDLFIYLSIF